MSRNSKTVQERIFPKTTIYAYKSLKSFLDVDD